MEDGWLDREGEVVEVREIFKDTVI